MKRTNEVVYKPNQTIMIVNGEITVTQRKAYNVILHKAWNELKTDKNKILFEFNISELKGKAGIKATNNVELKNNIRKLKNIETEIIKENGDWSIFNLISQADKRDDVLEIQLPEKIRQALIANEYYTTLDLLTLRSLEGKYAVILYEMAIRYQKTQIPEMTIEELKLLTGTEKKKSYDNFYNFEKKVLKPAIVEINEKTDILLDYDTKTRGNKVIGVKFIIRFKEKQIKTPKQIDESIHELLNKFKKATGEEFPDDILRSLIDEKGFDCINLYFSNIDKFTYTNPIAFFTIAIKKEYEIPKRKKSLKQKVPQSNNFEQRKYDDEFFDSLYENVGIGIK